MQYKLESTTYAMDYAKKLVGPANEVIDHIFKVTLRLMEGNIPGCFVECGVINGGNIIAMASALDECPNKTPIIYGYGLFMNDFFEGPKLLHNFWTDIAESWVGFGNIKAVDSRTILTHEEPMAYLRLSGNQDTLLCLGNLYHLLSPGGILEIDYSEDFHIASEQKKAVNDFFHGLKIEWINVANTSISYTQKKPTGKII